MKQRLFFSCFFILLILLILSKILLSPHGRDGPTRGTDPHAGPEQHHYPACA
jgi:hypothetical protein